MGLGLTPKAPPKRSWVSLSSALTWMRLDHAMELPDLVSFAASRGWSNETLREFLDAEWEELADYACGGSVPIRARQRYGTREIQLTTEDLRNFRHVGWIGNHPSLVLDRFPLTFSGGFRHNVSGERDGYINPAVSRSHLATYKRVRRRTWRSPADQSAYAVAERCLIEVLANVEPGTGLRLACISALCSKFEIPKYRSQEVWTKVLRNLGWPERGPPTNSEIESLRESTASAILSWRAN